MLFIDSVNSARSPKLFLAFNHMPHLFRIVQFFNLFRSSDIPRIKLAVEISAMQASGNAEYR